MLAEVVARARASCLPHLGRPRQPSVVSRASTSSPRSRSRPDSTRWRPFGAGHLVRGSPGELPSSTQASMLASTSRSVPIWASERRENEQRSGEDSWSKFRQRSAADPSSLSTRAPGTRQPPPVRAHRCPFHVEHARRRELETERCGAPRGAWLRDCRRRTPGPARTRCGACRVRDLGLVRGGCSTMRSVSAILTETQSLLRQLKVESAEWPRRLPRGSRPRRLPALDSRPPASDSRALRPRPPRSEQRRADTAHAATPHGESELDHPRISHSIRARLGFVHRARCPRWPRARAACRCSDGAARATPRCCQWRRSAGWLDPR